MNITFKYYFFFIVVLLQGCSYLDDINTKRLFHHFVNEHLNENFDSFQNINISIREHDREGNVALVTNNNTKGWIYWIWINDKTDLIKKTKISLSRNLASLDTAKMKILAHKFMKYNMVYLSVDSTHNAYFTTIDRSILIQVNNEKFVPSNYKKGWHHIKGKWFENMDY